MEIRSHVKDQSKSRDFTIRVAQFPADTNNVQHLLRLYAAAFPDVVQQFIREEGYFDEIDNEAKIWLTSSEKLLLLALDGKNDEAVGCAGLRPLEVNTTTSNKDSKLSAKGMDSIEDSKTEVPSKQLCELKRFFTAPSARGKSLGRMLL